MINTTPFSLSPGESDRGDEVRRQESASLDDQDSETWFSALFDSAMDGIIVLNERQRVVRFNPAAEAIFRHPASEALGKSLDRFLPNRFRKSHRQSIRAFGAGNNTRRRMGKVDSVQIMALRADGEEFPAEISISQFTSGGEKFFAAIVRDVSERQQVEKAFHESEARYRTLADAANDMIWIINLEGRIEYVNSYAALRFEKTAQELVGKLHRELFPAEVAARQWKNLQKVMQTGEPSYIEALNPFPKNSTWLGTSIAPLRNASGEIYAVLGIARDITARKEAELALQRQGAILEAVSSAAQIFLQAADWQDNIQDVLARLGQAAQVSRAYIFENHEDAKGRILTSQRFQWVSSGSEPQTVNPYLQNVPLGEMGAGRWLQALSQNQPLYGDVDKLPESERSLLDSQGFSSVVVVPIFSGHTFWGMMGCDESGGRRQWTSMEIQAFKTAADTLGAAIQRKQSEEVLRISEVEYRSLFEHALEGIYRAAPDGKILTANPALIKMLGFDSIDDLLPLNFYHDLYLRPENRGTIRQAIADVDELRNVELYLERKDGESIIVLNNSRTVRDVHRNILYYEGTMVDITERRRAVEQINRRVTELEALYESGLALSQTLDANEIGEKVIEVLAHRLNWDHAAVRLRQESGDGIELVAFSGGNARVVYEQQKEAHARAAITRVGQGLVGWVIQHGRVVRISNLDDDPRYVRTFPGMVSGMYIPMKVGDFTIGCIGVESPEPNAFSESDERLASTLSAQAAIAIENARLFKQTKRRLEQLSVLHQIDMVISSSADFHSTLKFALEHVLAQLKVDAAQVLLLDPATMMLVYADGVGFRSARQAESSYRLGESKAGQVVLERRPLFIPDLREMERGGVGMGLLLGEDFVTYGCMPLVTKGDIKGVLEVFSRELIHSDDEWMEFFQVLAGQAAIAIDNSLMFDDLQRSHLELSLAYDATIEGWSRALDLRDKETEGHTQRVTDLAVRLARQLGLNDAEIVHMRRGGLLHDIGKMGVSDTILNKPGALTDDEFQIMRRHPQYAYDMLTPISYLRPALDIPYGHHEKWDGSGYPLGLKGEAIPLVARIFAVSDVFDALTSDRPYRKAWPKKKTLDYLRDQSGRHFDPRIVEAFLTIIGEDE